MATVERIGEAIRDREVVVGQTRVVGVRARPGEDSAGEPAIFVRLLLSNPPEGLETWPAEDIAELRRAIRDVVQEVDPELKVPWFITFEPEDSGELEPSDTQHEVQIDP